MTNEKTLTEQKRSASRRIWSKFHDAFSTKASEYGPILISLLFLIPLALKIAAAFFFASTYATDLFIPFIKYFVIPGAGNPYEHFLALGQANAFPYPSLMLWTLGTFFASYAAFAGATSSITHMDFLILRLPLLVADLGILFILLSWFRKRHGTVLWLYWCSPVIFYINYIHGQLDALPIFLLFCFLYFIFKERSKTALIFLGLSFAAKTGMIIVFPFVCLYILKERPKSNLRDIAKTIALLLIPIAVFIILNIGYLFNSAFIEMVLRTKEQFKVFDLSIPYSGGLAIFALPIAYAALVFKFATFKRYGRDLFMIFLGFGFFTLTLLIPPMQGWYYWIIPFAAYFYIKADGPQRLLYHAITVAYFLYFSLIKKSDIVSAFFPLDRQIDGSSEGFGHLANLYSIGMREGLPMDLFINISFTILQATLLLNLYWIYRKGVEHHMRYKLHYKPYLIGVAGDSGSGKSTFAELMTDIFAPKHVSVIAGDDMHKWERGDKMWTKYTHLDPRANLLHSDIQSAYDMKHGTAITRKHYDHVSGKFTLPEKLESKRIVIFEGLHTLFLGRMRKSFDLRVFISPEDQLKLHWKIIRDFNTRGHSKEDVMKQVEFRQNDVEQYIKVQEKHADVIISFKNETDLGDRIGDPSASLDLALEMSCANDIGLQDLLAGISAFVDVDYRIHDEKQTIKFKARPLHEITALEIEDIAKAVVPELDDLSSSSTIWHSGYNGIIQLFIAFHIFESMKLERYDQSNER